MTNEQKRQRARKWIAKGERIDCKAKCNALDNTGCSYPCRYQLERADQILNQKWDNGLPMFGVLDPEQKLPECFDGNRPRALAFRNMQEENWRKVVGK